MPKVTGRTLESQEARDANASSRVEKRSRVDRLKMSWIDDLELQCRAGGEWEVFIDRCLQRYHATDDVAERVELLKRVAQTFEGELDDPQQAYDALVEAFRLDPEDHEASANLAAMAARFGRWESLLDAVRGMANDEQEPWKRLLYCEHAVRWCKEAPQGKEWKDAFLVEIHRIDPSHWAVRRRMASFYREQGIWDLRRTELERALLRARTNTERFETHYALAELHELRFSDLPRALEHYEAACAASPQCLPALQGIERICLRREMHERLREVLEKQLDVVEERGARYTLLMRLADLWEKRFLKPARAAQLLEEALALSPTDRGVLSALERCYRALRAWPDYVRTLERRVELSPLRDARILDLRRIGQVYESAMGDAAGALDAYRRAYALDPTNLEALTEIARLCERTQDWRTAAECRARLAEFDPDPKGQAQLEVAAGALLEPEGRDVDAARAHYERAAMLDPANVTAWEGLQRIAERKGDPRATAQCLQQRIARTDGPRARARLLVELGQICEVHLGAKVEALAAYERAHEADPGHAPAVQHLLRLMLDARRFKSATALCDALLRRALEDRDTERVIELLRASAWIARELKDPKHALTHALRAYAAFPKEQAIAAELVHVCHALRGEAAALRVAADALDALARQPARLGAALLVELGEVFWARGEIDRGIDALVSALAVDEACVPALTSLAEHFLATGDWERFSAYRMWLARATHDSDARYALLVDTGEVLAEQARDLEQAAWVYEEARALRPRDRRILERLVSIHDALGDWERLLVVQRAIVEMEELPALKASRLRSMAVVARTKLGESRRAAELFDEVLALDPPRLDALDELAGIHLEREDWRSLAAAHRRALVRADDWARGADELVRPRLPLAGTWACSAGRPTRGLETVTEGSSATAAAVLGATADDAELRTLRERIAKGPLGGGPYRSLYVALRRRHAVDAAYCVCSALRHLGVADAEQRRFVSSHRAPELHEAPGALTDSAWYSALLHPRLDRVLTAALNLAATLAVRTHAHGKGERMSRALGEPLSERAAGRERTVARAVRESAQLLGLPVPLVYERKGAPVAIAPTQRPAVFVSFTALDGTPAGAMPFVLGRHLAGLHPALAAHAAYPTPSELRMLYETAVRALDVTPGDETKNLATAMRKAMTDDERHELARLVRVLGERGPVDVERWQYLANVSTMRAGLLLLGDVDAAWEAMRREERVSGAFPAQELRAELLTFAVSDEHARMRRAIGLAVG